MHFCRVVGFDDPAITAAALLGLGEAHYRLDDEARPSQLEGRPASCRETPSTYAAWRNVAAARVRDGDLTGAIAAYREADRRAPPEDKAEIANRLGWLTKETGDTRASRRYFAKGRGDGPLITVTHVIIAVDGHRLADRAVPDRERRGDLQRLLQLDKIAVAARGVLAAVDGDAAPRQTSLHLFFNMYALYLVGPIVERWYGSMRFLVFYLACAAAGSVASFVFGGDAAVGRGVRARSSGCSASCSPPAALHHPVDRQSRGIVEPARSC